MRQHAILSCLVLLLGWGLLFGMTLFQTINTIEIVANKLLFLSVIPLCLSMGLWHRKKCRRIVFRANVGGFLGLLCLLSIRLYAILTQKPEWQILSILLMIPFIIFASLGFRAWWAWCFPSLGVLFAYPGWVHFSYWLQTKIIQLTEQILPSSAVALSSLNGMGEQIVPLSNFSIHWMVIMAFYGYWRYQPLGQRLLFYGLSALTFFTLLCIQACGLSGLLSWGGNQLLSQFNFTQLNAILILLGSCFLGYTASVLSPYKPAIRRMMNEDSDFIVLIDRHSHWLALTVVALGLMALSVWLGANVYRIPLSIMEIWR
jgi:hypothetical protein